MNTLVQRARQEVTRYIKRWKAEASARRFMEYCRKKWPWDPNEKHESVVMLGLFPPKIAAFCNLDAANALARRTGSRIEAFKLTGGSHMIRDIYASAGAKVGLDRSYAESALPDLEKQADEIFTSLQSKWDLLNLRFDGLRIGDCVYDSYLRYHQEPTVKLDDPRLREIIFQSLVVCVATTNYLKTHKVVGFIPDDFSYHECGIITKFMLRAGVPTFIVCYGPQYFLYRLFTEEETGGADFPIRWPYHHYRTIFRRLPEEEQARCREIGRDHLERKLAGELDRFTLVNISAFGASSGKIFPDSGKPRVVVLMHDFFDSPHSHRWMLFPDFDEWAEFLFTQAGKTEFEWYMKPHPCCWDAAKGRLNEHNTGPIDSLQKRFPHIKILSPAVSNRQMVEEGISAVFTMYGTAGHEFARMGVPVVNAGDNPHIAYDFNYHPSTVEEYADLIARANQLTVSANPDDLAEYVYMNYFYFRGHRKIGKANPLPAFFFENLNLEAASFSSTGYDQLIFEDDPAREAEMKEYYDRFFAENLGDKAPVQLCVSGGNK